MDTSSGQSSLGSAPVRRCNRPYRLSIESGSGQRSQNQKPTPEFPRSFDLIVEDNSAVTGILADFSIDFDLCRCQRWKNWGP